uniref:Uncharacterized protein n=1 Tax=Medicago truncatula TaxID=3880 RepID=I3SAN4_MEDTR|nr:unknown [Medicago truncatula]
MNLLLLPKTLVHSLPWFWTSLKMVMSRLLRKIVLRRRRGEPETILTLNLMIMQQKGKTRNRRKTKKMRRQKQRKKIRESVWMSPQLAISTSEQEGVRPLIATALLKG